MYTGYWVQDNFIFGPEESGKYWIQGKFIFVPKISGKFWIEKGFVFGPKESSKFWIDGCLYTARVKICLGLNKIYKFKGSNRIIRSPLWHFYNTFIIFKQLQYVKC